MNILFVSQAKQGVVALLLSLLMAFSQESSSTVNLTDSGGGVVISIEEDLLRCSSGDQDDPIVNIEVFQASTLVYSEEGCQEAICFSDLGHLATGSYVAKAYTANGEEGTENITLN